jgi:chemosensory pili system protein ChpA (sensor histidine kinase/response regulator)
MAGAETLGQQLHEMEFAVDQFSHCDVDHPLALQKLLAQLDHVIDLVAMLDEEIRPLLTPVTEPSLIPVTDKITATSIQLRVRADLLERISSSAAELTVGGARVANEFQLQRQAISDLTDNINRLRSQLRELEIQAETRITSQLQINNSREFDPLEFDHFTGLQELTRMMAESLGDIISVQRTLARHVDDAGLAISAQSRYARNLQTDLRRVRIVLFSSIAERLHHLVRQVGRELDKEVQLDITGGNIELDRSMLEKMGAPLEHLLRNAIAHGIESSEMRAQAGKPVIGNIKIILAQQANDVIIQVSDDGQGLDLERIREKAMAVGLLQADYSASEAELAALIFEAGLSTADEVTAIAGRGIGMDVVRATVLAQGGSIDVATQSGMGITFKIVLPLIQATTQVVLVHAGLQQMAIPSAMVEQVLQLPAARARIARQAAVIESRGKQLPLYHLSLLLGMSPATIHADTVEPPAQIIILRGLNGSFAIELDAIHGNREVVVKNIGPQLAHVIGIAGATVLADGSVVLIINPVALIESVLRTQRSGRPHNHDSVALHSTHAAIPLVLVVDDSLTVRRVSQRMLERCGYAVALARDGLDALEKLQTISPSVVLLDIEMPRMDGFELLRKLRQEPPTRELPVVMITSRSADKHREHALKLGATAYLGKPFNETELLALLKQLCAEDSLPAEQLDMA